MRTPPTWILAITVLLACAACNGGNFVHLPIFPDGSCNTCGTPGFASDAYRR
jgi:hypothetical protein